MDVELEPEDIELLDRVERETGKSVDQLIQEAIRATYGVSGGSESDTTVAIVEALEVINVQIKKMLGALEIRGQLIRSLSA